MFRNYEPRREAISSPYLRAIFDHWRLLLRNRPAPDIADFDATNLPAASLRYIIMTDITTPPLRVRYRLVGTHAVEIGGIDFTGKYLDELEMPEDAVAQIGENTAYVVTSCAPLIGQYDWPTVDGMGRVTVEYIILPLVQDGAVVRLLTAEHVGQNEECYADEIVPIVPIAAKVL